MPTPLELKSRAVMGALPGPGPDPAGMAPNAEQKE
jgi:hypothetical protein